MKYQSRIVDDELTRLLKVTGAVVLEGPKAVGKTWSAGQLSASNVFLDIDSGALQLAKIDPFLLLKGSTPRLIDEWQMEPDLLNHIRS